MSSGFDDLASVYTSTKHATTAKEDDMPECALVDKYSGNPTLRSVIGDHKHLHVIDVGCGNGTEARQLLAEDIAERVFGIDVSAEMIRLAIEATPRELIELGRVRFEVCDAKNIKNKYDGTFDLALCNFVLQFATTVDELLSMCDSIHRCLKPNGRLIGFLPNGVLDAVMTDEMAAKYGSQHILPSDGIINDGDTIPIRFLEHGQTVATTQMHWYFKSTYETCLRQSGFSAIRWHTPIVTKEGIERVGIKYWHDFVNPPKWLVLEAIK